MNRLCPVIALLAVSFMLGRLPPDARAMEKQEESIKTSAPDESFRSGGIYRVPLMNNPRTLDPAHVQDMYGVAVVQQVFNGLVHYSPELFVVPALAEDWRVENSGKAYRFFLRQDARFHNGRKVTAGDAVFSLTRLLRAAPSILPHLLKVRGARDYLERGRIALPALWW